MCEFISWKEVEVDGNKSVLFLDDEELFTERTKKILEGSADNDFMGHTAVSLIHGPKAQSGTDEQLQNFWETDQLPKEIQAKLHDFASFKKNFGRMITEFARKDDLEYIIKNAPTDKKWRGLKKFCRDILKDFFLKRVQTEVLEVNVRHDLSVDELVELNKFGWKNDCVASKNFPSKKGPAKKQELVLVSMGLDVKTKDALKMMKTLKLKAANPIHLLSLTLVHPNRQKENPFVALGQIWRGSRDGRYVPCAWGYGFGRRLGLDGFGSDWDSSCRFLAVRNS